VQCWIIINLPYLRRKPTVPLGKRQLGTRLRRCDNSILQLVDPNSTSNCGVPCSREVVSSVSSDFPSISPSLPLSPHLSLSLSVYPSDRSNIPLRRRPEETRERNEKNKIQTHYSYITDRDIDRKTVYDTKRIQ